MSRKRKKIKNSWPDRTGRRSKLSKERQKRVNTPEKLSKEVKAGAKTQGVRLSAGKKVLFSVAAFLLFFAGLEILLTAAGVKPRLYEADPYVGFSSYIKLFEKTTGPEGKEVWGTAKNKVHYFNFQYFPVEKPEGTFRIFCLGGSTTYGRPYDDNTSFCGWLREILPKADPSRNWEVINAGGISYASYRVALLMEELKDYSPDLFIVYSGQNEFLEKRTYDKLIETPSAVQDLAALAARTRTYTTVKKIVDALKDDEQIDKANEGPKLAGEVKTILERSVGPEAYQRDDELEEKIVSHYRYNLARLADIAKSCGAEIIYVTPASNLRNCSPFKSQHGESLRESQIEKVEQLYQQAKNAKADGKSQKALQAIDKAIEIDPRYAHYHYLRGQVLWDLGRYSEAKEAFVKAMDEDVCPLRAISSMGPIVWEVAAKKNAGLVDFAGLVEKRAKHSTPGEELFLDHVHPTIEMHKELAMSILDELETEKIVQISDDFGEESIREVSEVIESRIDDETKGMALRNLAQVFRWAGKFEEAEKLAKKAVQMVGKDAETHYLLAGDVTVIGQEQLPAAIEHLKKSIELNPGYASAYHSLGIAYSRLGHLDRAIGYFHQAQQIEPDDTMVLNSLGIAYQMKRDFAGAERYFKKAIESDPQLATTYSNLGNVYFLTSRVDEAIKYYKKSLELRPNVVKVHYNLGGLLKLQEKDDEALEHFRQALKINPKYAKAHLMMGNIFQLREDYDKAIEHYERTLELDPSLVIAHKRLYQVYSEREEQELASKHLEIFQKASKQGVNERGN